MNDFSEQVRINKYQLDDELVEQPQRYYDWAKLEAQAADEVARLKDKLEILKAEVEIRIRKHPTAYDLPDGPKEALIKAAIIVQPKVKRLGRKLLKAMKTHRLLTKAEKSFEHRKKALEGLVSLNMQMHFSTPKGVQRKDFEIEEQRDNLLEKARKKRRIKRR